MDDEDNERYGKELQPGAYIRHGYSIKYQCQCPWKSTFNCSTIKPSSTQCRDGQWTNDGPQCREGREDFCRLYLIFTNFFAAQEWSGRCRIPLDIPYALADNNTKLNNMLNDGESFDYQCNANYTRMTNVTCIGGQLTAQPLCVPSRNKISN